MASFNRSGGLRPIPERLDLNPTQARAVGVFADLVCKRHGGAKKAAIALGTKSCGLETVRRGAQNCIHPAYAVDALAEYAGCSRADLLAGRAVLPALPSTEAA